MSNDISRPISEAREKQDLYVVLGGEKSRAGAGELMMIPCQPCSNQPRRNIFFCACTLILLEIGGVASLSHWPP